MEDLLGMLKITITAAGQGQFDTAWYHTDMNNHFARIYCTGKGKGFISHHGKNFTLEPGKMQLVPTYSHMKTSCPDKMHHYWMHFNARVFAGIDLFDIVPPVYEVKTANQTQDLKDYQNLIDLYRSDSAVKKLETDTILRGFIMRFIKGSEVNYEKVNTFIRFKPALSYIEEHLTGHIDIKSVASVSGLHPTYFSNLFYRYMKISPVKYINARRIETAKTLLFTTDDSISQIAEKIGLIDQFYFSKIFKKSTGKSPALFRKELRKIAS